VKRVLVVLFLVFWAIPAFAYQGEVENIPSEKYFEVVLNEINRAQSSVTVCMYLVSTGQGRHKTRPQLLLEALVKAKERGVKVEVVLEQNQNRQAYEFLKENKIEVYFDDPEKYTHSKVVVIDARTVIVGSTNWTRSGIGANVESNLLARSEELARDVLEDLKKVPRNPAAQAPGVRVPWAFTSRKELLPRMVTQSDERALDVYLYLLKGYDGNPEAKVTVDYEDLSKSLGFEGMTREEYRRQINRVLKKLESEYRLIGLELARGEDATAILKDYENPTRLYRMPEKEFFNIPENFWNWKWNQMLSLSGKTAYFLNLSYAAISKNPPSWQASVKTLSERHHLSGDFISEGTVVLRRANLVEVEYSSHDELQEGKRAPNIYFLNPLYDPKETQKKLKVLETRWGFEKVKRAQNLAALVYEDKDVEGIKMLLELEDKYGQAVVEEAAKIMSVKNADNSRRSMGYFIGTIKGIGEKRAAG
jgi:hypothetical protein